MQPEIANALAEAAILLVVGMVMVFLFLSMLIGAITLIAWVDKFFPEATLHTLESHSKLNINALSSDQSVSPKVVAAITAAISQHKQSH